MHAPPSITMLVTHQTLVTRKTFAATHTVSAIQHLHHAVSLTRQTGCKVRGRLHTAFATSVHSARVGRGFLIMDSSIWVAQITGLPGRESSVCHHDHDGHHYEDHQGMKIMRELTCEVCAGDEHFLREEYLGRVNFHAQVSTSNPV